MMISEAVKLTGKSRTTILKALKNNKLSGEKDINGHWDIQPVDLLRLYDIDPSKLEEGVTGDTPVTPVTGAPVTPQGDRGNTPEINVLQAQLDAARQLNEERADTIKHLRAELEDEKQERREAQTKLTALLTDQRETAPQTADKQPLARSGFWIALAVVIAAVAALAVYLDVLPSAG